MLPCSVKDGVELNYIDSLYTSTSAVCVTGLIAVDAGDTFTPFGQFFLAMLIQIGGLGVTTIGVGIIIAMRKRVIRWITLAHIIANPDEILYKKLGLDPTVDYSKSAIGIVTMSPAETAIIAGDIAIKTSGAELGFVDRFSGTLIITGTVSEVEASLKALTEYCQEKLGFNVCPITRT